MAVVIARSRATAHVVRIFGALVALLVLMAVGVAVVRLRAGGGESPSPYGALPGAGTAAQRAAPAIAPAVRTASGAPAPAEHAPASGAVIAMTDPVTGSMSGSPSAPAAATDPNRMQPRVISLDRAAAGSTVPQPAPPAVVQAAARAAAVPTPAPPGAAAAPAPTVPAAVAVMDPKAETSSNPLGAPDAANPAAPPGPGGLININTATAAELDAVGAGHIGKTIVRHRPYRSIDDLLDHRVLKAGDFARIRGAITAN